MQPVKAVVSDNAGEGEGEGRAQARSCPAARALAQCTAHAPRSPLPSLQGAERDLHGMS